MILIPIEYRGKSYPNGITPSIKEVAGHFDITSLNIKDKNYSLHTEYSFGKRRLDLPIIESDGEISKANIKGIPQLWFSDRWASEFAYFIIKLTQKKQPKIIEIHPPFRDYCDDMSDFIQNYEVFEKIIKLYFPDTIILIENRNDSNYNTTALKNKDSKFLVSTVKQIVELSEILDKKKLSLKITLDIPQLFKVEEEQEENKNRDKMEIMKDAFEDIKKIRHNIMGIHLWGRRNNRTHYGDLNDLFENSKDKELFLDNLVDTFKDNVPRYFVPEVNFGADGVTNIVNDLMEAKCIFQ